MSIDKSRFKTQYGKLFIDGRLTTIPSISSFDSIKDSGKRGVIIFATDNLSRPVAVKIWMLSSSYSADAFKEGLKEATKLANLEHPNILQVFYAGGDSNNRFYSVMKRLNGPTLKEYLNETRSLEDRYALWFDIARAINYAHDKGIYHGDLHLGNITVEDSRAKIFDFGASMTETNEASLKQMDCIRLKNLANELFPEFEQKVLLPINILTQSKYCPELVLCQLVSWITWEGEYLALKQVVNHRSWDDYMIKSIIFGIQIKISIAPLFHVDEIISRCSFLTTINSEERAYMIEFLSGLYAECDRRLRGDYKWAHPYPIRDKEELKAKTINTWNSWQEKFLSNDMGYFTEVVSEFLPLDENYAVKLPTRISGPIT